MKIAKVLLGVALLTVSTVGTTFASDGRGVRQPLDLPAGLTGPPEEDEEDSPETIVFYGSELEGDAFFWCFPIYGFCGDLTVYQSIREEINSALMQLSKRSLFSLVGYNSQTYVWSYQAKKANEANKASGIAWMQSLIPVEAHCLLEAAVTTLNISQGARGNAKQLVVMGARTPYCGTEGGSGYATECLTTITASNYENSRMNTVYFTSTFYSGEQDFYVSLASMNGGSFKQVDY